MEGLKVVDDTTFTVELAQAESDFPLRLGYTAFYPLPESAYADPQGIRPEPGRQRPVQAGCRWLEA